MAKQLHVTLTPSQGIALLELVARAETLPGRAIDGRDRALLLRAGGRVAEAFERAPSGARSRTWAGAIAHRMKKEV